MIVQVLAFIKYLMQAYKLLQLTVDIHLSFLMELWATRKQLRGPRHTIVVMMASTWREKWQQYAEQMEDGALLQSAGQAQVYHLTMVYLISQPFFTWIIAQ